MMELQGVKKSYRKNPVLKGIDMVLREGECVGIAGANGAGKSTLLKIVVGAWKADAGQILIHGISVSRGELGERTGYVPQENPLFEELSVKDNLELWYGGDRERLKRDCQDGNPSHFGIMEYYKKTVRKLSGGMKKRLSICCALASEPEILVMDEPGAALDLTAKKMILDTIKNFTKSGKSVIIASHELPELMMCDRVYGMKDGVLTELEKEISSDYLHHWIEG